jgi:hypothetical protein
MDQNVETQMRNIEKQMEIHETLIDKYAERRHGEQVVASENVRNEFINLIAYHRRRSLCSKTRATRKNRSPREAFRTAPALTSKATLSMITRNWIKSRPFSYLPIKRQMVAKMNP